MTIPSDYPERLSRALALVKWWLLALPHYLVLGLFLGGSVELWRAEHLAFRSGGGLITVLVLIAAVALLVHRSLLAGLFDLVLGLNRWVLRVIAYALLLTDRYPPFRLDQGDGADEPIPPRTSPDDVQLGASATS